MLQWNIKEKDSPLSGLVEILELRKGLIYLSCIEGKGVVKTFTVVQKMLRYLLIYYKIFLILNKEDLRKSYFTKRENYI